MALGQIRLFAGSFAPENWAFCDGALLNIREYGPLYQQIGTRYGGDGRTTFALPDLRGRAPMHRADGAAVGTKGKFSVAVGTSDIAPARLALNFIIAVAPSYLLETFEPFLGEVRPFTFNFAPVSWAKCEGQILPISSYTALYVLLETAYGGNGSTTFALPNLRGAYPFQPDRPSDRGRRRGIQVYENPSPQQPLLTVNYCIAVQGIFPPRRE
jgi:microcystin-dependent protein